MRQLYTSITPVTCSQIWRADVQWVTEAHDLEEARFGPASNERAAQRSVPWRWPQGRQGDPTGAGCCATSSEGECIPQKLVPYNYRFVLSYFLFVFCFISDHLNRNITWRHSAGQKKKKRRRTLHTWRPNASVLWLCYLSHSSPRHHNSRITRLCQHLRHIHPQGP